MPSKRPVSLAVRHLQCRRGTKFSFLDYLVLTQLRNCSDARDKVFSIFGVSNTEDIKADYSKSVKDIFRDTARYLIQKDQISMFCQHANTSTAQSFEPSKFKKGLNGSEMGPPWDNINLISSMHYFPAMQK